MPTHPLSNLKIVSLALNVPGPTALSRCREMGAECVKVEPPAGDPLRRYCPAFYASLHVDVRVLVADLKTDAGQQALAAELRTADVLLSSFRPSAIERLGLGRAALQAAYPRLSHVAIVGAAGARAEEPGHDLTYMTDHDLVPGTDLPPTLYADMSGALLATEAVLRCMLTRGASGAGSHMQVALADGAGWLALPRRFGLTLPEGFVGGAHAGYRVYRCRDGRVAVAALEPHFAAALCSAAGIETADGRADMQAAATHSAVAAFFASRGCAELDRLGRERDIPLHTLAAADPVR